MQGRNHFFLHESLAPCHCEAKVNRNMYLTISMAFVHQLQTTFPESIQPEDVTSELAYL